MPEHPDHPRGAEASAFRPKVSPYCASLSSKKILGSPGLPMTDSDVLDASNWCWCVETAQLLGPDRKAAHPEDCRKGRSCFRSPYEDLL